MIDSRIKRMSLSPQDAATYRQWRRAVCALYGLYAGILLILAAMWGVHHVVKPGSEVQIADSASQAPAAEAARAGSAARRQ
jgi:hypothetical protein